MKQDEFDRIMCEMSLDYMKDHRTDFLENFDLMMSALELGIKTSLKTTQILMKSKEEGKTFEESKRTAIEFEKKQFYDFISNRKPEDVLFIREAFKAYQFGTTIVVEYFNSDCICSECPDPDCPVRREDYVETKNTEESKNEN